MDLTEAEVLALGEYCGGLMSHEHFNTLSRLAELNAFQSFSNTAAEDKDGRERAYAELTGLRNFLAMMLSLVERRDALLEEMISTPSSDDDA